MSKLSPVFEAFMRQGAHMFIAARLAPTEQEHAGVYYELLQPERGATVVDMGSGTGVLGELLQEIDPSLKIINVVNDAALVTHMESTMRACVYASFVATGLPEGIADAVLFNESIGHGHLSSALAEAARVLRPGGTLLIKDFSPTAPWQDGALLEYWGYHVHSIATMLEFAAQAGLRVESITHPTMHTQHWKDIIAREPDAAASAALHDPTTLPLRMVVYRFTKVAA